jgi:hypothetical protein
MSAAKLAVKLKGLKKAVSARYFATQCSALQHHSTIELERLTSSTLP